MQNAGGSYENTARHGNAKGNLALFIKCVLKEKELPKDFISRANVDKEYLIPDTDRRIDLAFYTENFFIPVEVKIYAEDRPSQCFGLL